MKNSLWVNRHGKVGTDRGVGQVATSGFTLLEMLLVVAIAGILAVIAAPSWLSFVTSRTLSAAQDQAYQAIRQAQIKAKHTHVIQQASFREVNGFVQWAIHTANALPAPNEWQNLPAGVRIDIRETTLLSSGGMYRVQFNQQGNVNGQLGRLTFASQRGGTTRRCVIVSTLIGALRKGSEHQQRNGSFSCY